MEEQKTLTKEQVKDLHQQYSDITDDLHRYRHLFRERRFWKSTKTVRKNTRAQYQWSRFVLNETLITLMDQKQLRVKTATDAIGNRFVKLKIKYMLVKYLRKYGDSVCLLLQETKEI